MKIKINEVDITYHINGNVLDIAWFHVPVELREEGLGSKTYLGFEKTIPDNIEIITLEAGDPEGRGHTDEFWESLGFSFIYETEEGDQDMLPSNCYWVMQKVINPSIISYTISKKEWLDMVE